MQNLRELFDAMCAGKIEEWDTVPVFANKGVEHDFGVWSWDEQNAIVGESRDVLAIRPYSLHNGRIAVDWDSAPVAQKK